MDGLSEGLPAEYQQDEGLRTLANFLRSENGVKTYKAVEHDKRVEFFKGKAFIEVLTNMGNDVDPKKSTKWPRSIPKITDVGVALLVGQALLDKNFFHRSEKVKTDKGVEKELTVSPVKKFESDAVYTWMYQGGMMLRYIMSGYVLWRGSEACTLPAAQLSNSAIFSPSPPPPLSFVTHCRLFP